MDVLAAEPCAEVVKARVDDRQANSANKTEKKEVMILQVWVNKIDAFGYEQLVIDGRPKKKIVTVIENRDQSNRKTRQKNTSSRKSTIRTLPFSSFPRQNDE